MGHSKLLDSCGSDYLDHAKVNDHNLPFTLIQAQEQGLAPWDQYQDQLSTEWVAVYLDRYPVTEGHLLFVPRVNTEQCMMKAMLLAVTVAERYLALGRYQGYNIGINVGTAAGQTVPWRHIHLIPRDQGDCADPRGGVRGVIPEKQRY